MSTNASAPQVFWGGEWITPLATFGFSNKGKKPLKAQVIDRRGRKITVEFTKWRNKA